MALGLSLPTGDPVQPEQVGNATSARPRFLTRYIGRDADIVQVCALLRQDHVRLVTITGPGGVGKTRLISQLRPLVETSFDHIWFVPLAAMTSVEQAALEIHRVLGLSSQTTARTRDLPESNQSSGLLMLDNAEHLPTLHAVVLNLLEISSDLTILTTSRARIGLPGEHVYHLPPLAFPPESQDLPVAEILGFPAVQLFVDRASAADSSLTITADTARDIAAICRHLDGLPLAIELVASRVSSFQPSVLRRRLDQSLPLPASNASEASPRLMSIEQSIAWSIDLLAPREQDTLEQVAIFAGPWLIGIAEGIVSHGAESPPGSVVESIDHLINHNLVTHHTSAAGLPCHALLETVRIFALNRLRQRPDHEEIRARYVAHFESLARDCYESLYRPDGNQILADMDLQIADVQRILEWLAEHDGERLIQFAAGLSYLWGCMGRGAEGRPWLERSLAIGQNTSSPHTGAVLIALSGLVHIQGKEDLARTHALAGLADDNLSPTDRQHGMILMGLINLRSGDIREAITWQQRALANIDCQPMTDGVVCVRSTILGHLGNIHVALGDMDAADDYFTEALAEQERLGTRRGGTHVLASHPIAGLGDVARARRDNADALSLYQEALTAAAALNDYRATVYAIGGVAGSLASLGLWQDAATLFGAAQALHQARNIDWDLETMDRQRALGLPEPWLRATDSFGSAATLRNRVAGPALLPVPHPTEAARLWSIGAQLPLTDAVQLALSTTPHETPVDEMPPLLSAREIEVLGHVAAGLTDAQIADILFISRRTVSNHVRNIATKLNVTSRAAAAATGVRLGLL